MAIAFHGRAGSLVTLSNNTRTAQRNHPTQEFNNGVVLSSESLRENQLFEVRIDKKVSISCAVHFLVIKVSLPHMPKVTVQWQLRPKWSECDILLVGQTSFENTIFRTLFHARQMFFKRTSCFYLLSDMHWSRCANCDVHGIWCQGFTLNKRVH